MPAQKISKFIGVPLKKEFAHSEEGHLLALGAFTSDNPDEWGDIITRGATERAVEKYRKWGNIRYMHQPKPVGKITRIGKADGLKWNEVEFKVIDRDTAYEVEQGLLTALSVGILVAWDDIELIEEGGFKILDYQLAEISLVDHPANYDAVLKGADAGAGLRLLAKEYGFEIVAREMATLLNMNIEEGNPDMPNEVTEEITEEPIEEEENPVLSDQDKDINLNVEDVTPAETEETEEEAVEVEEPVEEQVEVEEPVEEVDLSIGAEEIDSLHAQMEDLITVTSKVLEATLALTTIFNKHLDSLEVPTEESEATDSDLGEGEQVRVEEENEETESVPVNRDAVIAPQDTMDLSEEEQDAPETRTLKESLLKYFQVREGET